MYSHTFAVGAIAIILSTHGLDSQGRAQYRDVQLSGDLASVATLAGIPASAATVIHQRPALIQDLEWRPTHSMSESSAAQSDPVRSASPNAAPVAALLLTTAAVSSGDRQR